MKQLITNIDEKLHTRFKTACAANGDTMSEIVIEAIEDYVNMYPELWPASTDDNSLEME